MSRTGLDSLASLPRHRLIAELSLWSADLARMADDVARTEPHVDVFHIDVADGHFAPSMLFFPDLVARIRALTKLPLHVHLMVADAILLAQVGQFAEAGADLITVHVENANASEALALIDRLGLAAGVVARIETPVDALAPFLDRVRFVTLLGTAIGVKGQSLAAEAPDRLRAVHALLRARGLSDRVIVAADGGIRETTVPTLRAAGAQTVVLGSLAFGAPDLAQRIAWLHALPAPAE
jgi:ribulose-phosphate 3-epimerase